MTIGRRFFANVSDRERDLIAYWQMVKLVEEERHRPSAAAEAGTGPVEASTGPMAGKRLIDQALATVLASDSLKSDDQIALSDEQALVWAIYLRTIARHRGLASDEELELSVSAARGSGISAQEIEAALAAGNRPGGRTESDLIQP